MTVFIIVACVLILMFAGVLLVGAPYLPTLSRQQQKALDLLDLKPGQTLLELGSGDGRILKAAAKQGIKGVGYELNPLLYVYSKLSLLPYRRLVAVKFGNFWHKSVDGYDGIYIFLLDKYMDKLNKKFTQEITNHTRVVSFGFRIPNKKPTTEVDGLYLYTYYNNN